MFIQFSHPWFLLLGLLFPLIWYISSKGHAVLSPLRKRIALFLRFALFALLILSLARTQICLPTTAESVFFLVDASDSITSANKEFAQEYVKKSLKNIGKDDKVGIVLFGKEALIEFLPKKGLNFSHFHTRVNPHQTNIEDALRLAVANFPKGGQKRIVLLTDGNETVGDADKVIDSLKKKNIRVDVLPLVTGREGEVLLEKIIIPEKVKKGEKFKIKLIGYSFQGVEAILKLYRNGELLRKEKVNLKEGQNVFLFSQSLKSKGFYTYEAVLETWRDTIPENNRVYGYTVVEGEPKLLLLTEKPNLIPQFLKSFNREKFQLEIKSILDAPSSLSELKNYDAIILDDVSAFKLSSHQLKILESYVKDLGGGLLAIGGKESFGLGGYQGTSLEEALPVYAGAQERLVFPNVTVVLVIDKSGSMGGNVGNRGDAASSSESKLLLAKKAAMAVVDLLTGYENIGVLSFDTTPRWTVPIQSVADRSRIAEQLSSLVAGGGTSLFPALKEAFEKLRKENSIVKHIIVLSDGLSEKGEFEKIVKKMAEAKITVSTVAIGNDADIELMKNIAQWGKGKFYFTSDIHSLPRIFTTEVLRVSRSLTVEEPFIPLINEDSPILSSEDKKNIPPLKGYLVTTPKSVSYVHMYSPRKDPLIVTWRYGLGKAAALTFDLNGPWSRDWQRWSGYSEIFANLINWILPRSEGTLFPLAEVEEEKGHLLVDAISKEGEFINFLSLKAQVVNPQGEVQTISLKQTAPGRYEGFFSADEVGSYMISVFDENKLFSPQITGTVVPYSSEYRKLIIRKDLLYQLVSQTGGKILKSTEDFFPRRKISLSEPKDIWSFLVLFASFLFLADVGVRTVSSHIWKLLVKKFRLIVKEKLEAVFYSGGESLEDYEKVIRENKEIQRKKLSQALKSRTERDDSYSRLLHYMAQRRKKNKD